MLHDANDANYFLLKIKSFSWHQPNGWLHGRFFMKNSKNNLLRNNICPYSVS